MAKSGPDLPGATPRFSGARGPRHAEPAATVSRLVAGVFHELNNSLQVIGGLAELLQDTPGIPPSVADGLRRIHEQNAKAGVAIAEVMAFSRQKTDERDRVNMRDLTTRSVALRTFAIGRARLTIAYEPPNTASSTSRASRTCFSRRSSI